MSKIQSYYKQNNKNINYKSCKNVKKYLLISVVINVILIGYILTTV